MSGFWSLPGWSGETLKTQRASEPDNLVNVITLVGNNFPSAINLFAALERLTFKLCFWAISSNWGPIWNLFWWSFSSA